MFFTMVSQVFWSLKHGRRFRLILTKSTFANLALILNVSERAVRMRSVAHSTSELVEMRGHESSHLILGSGTGVGLSKQTNIEKLNCLG